MILIALGANLPSSAGPPAATLKDALVRLAKRGVRIRTVSPFYESPAWPNPADPVFVNAVALVETDLQPVELLTLLHGIETDLGRLRSTANAPRSLDLDLLDYEGRVMTQGVTLPHPRLAQRAFVLMPLAEIAPGWRHPESGRSVAELLAELPDRGGCKKLA
jgi:2-amino-4-hydroxy-6-hydroxymethyldihydropteridine diphosphokinase